MRYDELENYFTEQRDNIQQHRRNLHRIPELSFEEIKTSAYIEERLVKMGASFVKGIGKTGIIARFGKPGGRRVALRADIDALPIQEENDCDYRSQHAGVMHACGHDAHAAMLLGVAGYLKSIEEELDGEILAVFQPAEERSDGNGLTGARYVLQSGYLDGVNAMLGMHVMSSAVAGKFGILSGGVMSSGDMFRATIYGKGGHDAWPNQTIDPIFITNQVLSAIYAIRSRKIDPNAAGTLSVGSIEGGTTANVIPEEVKISGAIRTFDQDVRDVFVAELERALKLAEHFGGSYQLDLPFHVPVTVNSPRLAEVVQEVCADLFEPESMLDFKPGMAVEDFSWYSQQIPSLFIFLGARLGDLDVPHHNPKFDIDDSVLYRGSMLMAAAALAVLNMDEG